VAKRLAAEWEKQDGILIAWPDKHTDWACILKDVEDTYIELVKVVSEFEKVVVLTYNTENLQKKLKKKKVNISNIVFAEIPYNDTWARDFGPLVLKEEDGFEILDFTFNGWGLKFPACFDNLITRKLYKNSFFKNSRLKTLNFVLEGGAIETNGEGIILTTERCLLSPNRNPEFSKEEIETRLKEYLSAKEIIWIKNGYLEGDDTDSHIDTLVRFAPENTILYVSPPEDKSDPHYNELKRMEEEIENLKNRFNILPLPFAPVVFDKNGNRLPSTYANFLITNEALLLPSYRDKKLDFLAIEIIKQVFPAKEIVMIDSIPLIHQHGSIHCITMQLPQGILNV
jgi:agmatine deiminase